jgi:parallel beta-helix repeat protein
MLKLKKLLSFWSFLIIFAIVLISFIKVISADIKFSHKGIFIYQKPFPWLKYNIETSFKKSLSKLFNKYKETGLPPRLIYINSQNEKKLLASTPNSTKDWVSASIYYDKVLKNIRLRHGGDNPINWMLEKKRLRIKSNKLELFDQKRYLEYFPLNISNLFSYEIMSALGLISNHIGLVEVYINGISKGIFHEKRVINESFIRHNKIMPINVYKGENHAAEKNLTLNSNLFENSSLWSKISIFNQFEEQDKTDLNLFLSKLKSVNTQEKADITLNGYIDLKRFSKYQAYYVLTQNYNNLWFHNMRLTIDPWKGQIDFIEIDPFISNQVGSKFQFDLYSNDLISFLSQSSEFNYLKYIDLWEIVNNEILHSTFKKIDKDLNSILISSDRDPEFNRNKIQSEIIKVKNILKNNQKTIKEKFLTNPNSFWANSDDYFSVQIDDITPISNLELEFFNEKPKWVAIDLNNNKIAEKSEMIKINFEDTKISLPVSLFANRTRSTHFYNDINHLSEVKTVKTRFNFLISNNLRPKKVKAQNIFSNQKFNVKKIDLINASLPNKYNIPVGDYFNPNNSNNIETLSGNIIINDNKIYENNVIILPGTTFQIAPRKNLVFKNKLIAEGQKNQPIVFKKLGKENWGTIALVGAKTSGSILKNIRFYGGSGGNFEQYRFTSTLSLHNTKNILIDDSEFYESKIFDDVIHVIYCEDIKLNNLLIKNTFGDSIDIDISKNVKIMNSKFINSGNDSIDFMESNGLVKNNYIYKSGDKGVSVGENSSVNFENNLFEDNNIGLAIKDRSYSIVKNNKFKNNNIHISAYPKNWRYGGGGNVEIVDSEFISINKNIFEEFQNSKIKILNSKFTGEKSFLKKKTLISK